MLYYLFNATFLWLPFLKVDFKGSLVYISLLIVLLLVTFVISGAEVAFFSLNNKDIDTLKTKTHSEARKIVSLLSRPREVYSSLLISGTFINICIVLLGGYLLNNFLPYGSLHPFYNATANSIIELLIRVFIITFLLVLFGQIFPKVWATQNNIRFAYGSVFLVEALHMVLMRVSFWSVQKSDAIYHRFGGNDTDAVSLQEIEESIDVQTDEESSPEEKNLIKGIVKFGHITVKQVMQSRTFVLGIDYAWSFEKIVEHVVQYQLHRMPVYKKSLDQIIGIINSKDLLQYLNEKSEFDWHTLIRPVLFVPEAKLLDDLLHDLQARKIQFAVVVDEFGGTSGIVTLYDIVEEVVGEVNPNIPNTITAGNGLQQGNTFLFDGKTSIIDMCKAMKIPTHTFDNVKQDSDSVGGLLLEITGHIPIVNDEIITNGFMFKVTSVGATRIKTVDVKPV